MPPKKRTITGSGHPQAVDGEVVEPTPGTDSPSGTADEPTGQPEPVDLNAASIAALMGELKEMRERLAAPAPGRPAILDGIQGIMLDVTGVGKHGQMDAAARMGNYKYQRYDDLKRELGAAFRKHDVFLQSTTTNLITDRVGEGGRMSRVVVSVTYRFTSLMDGSELTFDSHGESIDKSDKATGKAMTMALKTALIQAFMLAAEDTEDPDATRPGEDAPAAREVQRQRPAAQDVPRPSPDAVRQATHDVPPSDGPGYPNDGPRRDAWDTGPVADQRTPGELAAAAVTALSAPGLTMAKWSEISAYAKDKGIYDTMVTTPDGSEMALKHHLVAVGRTL